MKTGDLVKGLPNAPYGITNKKMKKAVVLSVSDEKIEIKVLQHENGNTGKYKVEKKYFEVIGEVKGFNREELLKRLTDGEKEAIFDYNLSHADLSRADLSDANLSDANLSGANLSHADLSDANLSDADLSRADLSHANLSDANLSGANLSHADLSDANLSDANLSRADLRYANLRDADLSRANLDFSCVPLWCGALLANMDDRQVKQLLYHTLSIVKHSTNVSQNLKDKLLTEANLEIAKEFHRAQECNKL